ncbi:MAG: glycerophosphodiester phosphodiesterase [Lachnospiraceae bacterium]|nr:glycerophosphodiester phosphodiesterase [Lachnospiraceae bacterium]
MLILAVLLLLPFLNIGMASSVLTTISIPEFIQSFIESDVSLSLLFTAATLFLTALLIKWLYAFHYFTLEGCSFREARRKSKELGKKRRFRDFLWLLFVQLVFALFYLLFVFVAVALAALAGKWFAGVFVLRWLSATFVWTVLVFSLILVAALAMPVSYGCISVLYYRRKEERGEAVIHSQAPQYIQNEKQARLLHRCFVAAGWLVTAGSLALGFFLCSGRLNPQIEYVRTMEITAHRGASAFYPENTMAAFRGAKELGADWIELDVQQSKDGQILVIHDTNLLRTTGVDANTWEMTYEEIAKLDAGSFFDEAYAKERIPLLSEAARFARENRIRLNIELKPTGYEKDFEQAVVDVIHQEGIQDTCVVTSQTYEVLERVKTYDNSITTVYVMSLAYGDINQLAAADHFSVEAMNATESLVDRVHHAGKQLYVWTVNTKESIDRMIERNVDNIITDDIELAKKCVYESRYSNFLAEYIKLFD